MSLNAWLRYDVIRRVLRGVRARSQVLEIGAGQGAVGARLAERFEYVGVEADATSAAVAVRRVEAAGGTLLHGDINEVDLDGLFDIICAFEVLEHIEDDRAALKDWRTRLSDSGRLVLSVPAHQHRYGAWDEAVGHYRRYGREALSQLLRECGFTDVQVFAYGFPLGYLLEAARDRIAARSARSHITPEAATATCGRRLQPPAFLGVATWIVTAVPVCAASVLVDRTRHRPRTNSRCFPALT